MGKPLTKSSSPSPIEKELAELQEQYIRQLPKKLDRIKDLWQKLIHYSWNDDALALLQRLAHSLAGSGKTFGFEQLSADARKLDDYLAPFVTRKKRPSADERSLIDVLIKAMEATAVSWEARQQSLTLHGLERFATPGRSKTVYIVDDDTQLAHYLATILSNIGYQVRTFTSPRLALEFISQRPADLVIMDIMFPEGNLAGIEIIDELRAAAGKRVPVVFVSARTDLHARVTAVRSGGDAYLTKPIDMPRLLEKTGDLISVYENEAHRVMIVDDDEELSAYYALILRKAGMDVRVVNKPVQVLETLDSFNPDILLMDMYMPEYNGMELASVIRQEDKFIALPIVFVSAEGSKEVHEQAFRLGVDDFIVKPVRGEQLVETIRRQVKRARKLNLKISKLSKYDSKTLLANRQYFLEQLELALATSEGSGSTRALIDISIRNVDTIIGRVGLEWLEALNQQIANIIVSTIGENDLATQFSEKVYMVLAHHADMEKTLLWAQTLREAITGGTLHLGGFDFKLSGNFGIIPLSDKVTNLHALLIHAMELSDQGDERGDSQLMVSEKAWESGDQPVIALSEASITEAMKSNHFKLAYQAIINLENNNDEKYEVLLRLQDSKGKVLLPQQFFPVVKERKLVPALDRWVIEHAISTLASNSHARGGTDIFIKISFESLQDPMLLPRISNSVTSSGLPGEKRIVFEINEKDLMIDQTSVAEFCKQVRKLKCGISITNYGQSPQGVQVFSLLPVDYVKLHGSCLENILVDPAKQRAIKQLIDAALQHRVQVIAGTIEDPATLSLLWDLGARFFQGYYINEPDFALDYNFALSVMH